MNINNLPNEILLGIFEAGYIGSDMTDNPLDQHQTHQAHPHRRKPFVSLVRRVCWRWRLLIDDPNNPRTHCARVNLGCYGKTMLPEFAKFKHYLATSNGCDISVRF